MGVTLRQVEPSEWTELLDGFADADYRHTAVYARLAAARSGASSELVAYETTEGVVGLANVRIRSVPVIGSGLAYVSGGPVVRRNDRSPADCAASLRMALDALAAEYADRRGLVLRAAPPMGDSDWDSAQARAFAAASFERTARTGEYRTFVLDLRASPAALRSSLRQKWRNGLNNAERQGLELRSGTDDASFLEFVRMYRPFQARKGFRAEHDADFYASVQAQLSERQRLYVQLAVKAGQTIAGHVSSMLGDTCVYLLGTTTDEGLRCKAAYLLQWRTILSAQERGMLQYDLGGIDPDGNPGVYHFKSGLGGAERRAPGPFERRPVGLRAVVALSAESLYRRLSRARTGATQ
jgi:Acetyltransferase (GNAT) domain